MRKFSFPGRSLAYGQSAMVATSHASASMIGIDVLKAGGNAVDASIAIAAALSVLEPAMTGIGGDCFALLWKPKLNRGKGGLVAMNAAGRAPEAATCEWYAKQGIRSIDVGSPHAVTVPGCIDGWSLLLKDHGTMPLGKLLGPAIELASRGFPVAPRVAYDWPKFEAKIRAHDGGRKHLLIDGRAPREREIMRFPALAKTLRAIAEGGRDALYSGAVAEDLVATLKELGGLHTLADFAAQKASYVEPIKVPYGSIEVHQLPPSNQGIIGLLMLNMLKHVPGYREAGALSVTRYHVLMEAARLAYAVRDAWLADPDAANVPTEEMLSDAFAKKLAKRIDPKRYTRDLGPVPKSGGTDTVYFAVADKDGMMVSFINSLFSGFGTGIVGKKSGVSLHNRGQGFTLDPKHPSCIAPGKRPMHTLIPGFATRDGRPHMAFGVMGANFQPMGHVFVVTGMEDCGLDAQSALDAPRMFYEHGVLGVEESVPAEIVEGLRKMGHKPVLRPDPWGGGQIVLRDQAEGVYVGASDARKDGAALGY
jgi:gamma-glutamyltranspeptidase/glutathione hydrolase